MQASGDPVTEVVRDNAASLLRLARQHSLCDDDAADAYQRTLVIYLERIDRVDRASAGAWLRTVCKHEAIRLRASRQRVAPADPMEWDEQPAADPHEADERAASLERVARAAEALRACQPDEARAMLLRADGSSYAEIGELCGWSYSKVNRSLADGRARFLKRFARIESGAACAGYAHLLSAIVDGEATPDDYVRLRPHLRHCASCRSTLKAMYDCEPALGALVPAGALVLAASDGPGFLSRAFASMATEVGDRVARAHAVFEAATATKAAAVVASTAAVAAGGAVAVDQAEPAAPAPAQVSAANAAARVGARLAPRATAGAGASASPAPGAGAAPGPPAAPPADPAPSPTQSADPKPAGGAPRADAEGGGETFGAEAEAEAGPPPAAAARDFGDGGPAPAAPTEAVASSAEPPAAPVSAGFERAGSGSAGGGGGGGIGFEG